MSAQKRIAKILALLIPGGVFGISSALATAQAQAETSSTSPAVHTTPVADRLREIRKAVSAASLSDLDQREPKVPLQLAEWLNVGGGVGWRNGGWGNGGWHNWGNGGWHNWGNGGGWHNWGNGWHNFWHNW